MVFVGIDVGKKELVVGLCDAAGEAIGKGFGVSNNASGHARLWRALEATGRDGVRVCLESTGVYGERAAVALRGRKGVVVSIVNPARINAYARAQLKPVLPFCARCIKIPVSGKLRHYRNPGGAAFRRKKGRGKRPAPFGF
ncbi:MAG: transposase [Nitrospinae bacterium]|nr:transposase [Nitrospinota bacterium]